ncbi:unnamed protein product [Lathyrus sativus]|nr:unnamed protein product [Lathyrus sativus]
MALSAFSYTLILLSSLSIFIVTPSYSFNPRKLVNVTSYSSPDSDWSPSVATWYGSPDGDGSEGGACGYGNAVGQSPFSSLISAGSPAIYDSGKGCGSCYEVRCTGNSACSGNPVRVVVTDECAGCGSDAEYHFDLSGTSFGSMAISGQDQELRNAGIIKMEHRRVECNYAGRSIAFRVDSGSNHEYFATLIEYEEGDGDLSKVEVKEALDSSSWDTMQQSWGAVWKFNKGAPLHAPFSIRLTTLESGKTIVAENVIPAGWKPGQTYRSIVNF